MSTQDRAMTRACPVAFRLDVEIAPAPGAGEVFHVRELSTGIRGQGGLQAGICHCAGHIPREQLPDCSVLLEQGTQAGKGGVGGGLAGLLGGNLALGGLQLPLVLVVVAVEAQ